MKSTWKLRRPPRLRARQVMPQSSLRSRSTSGKWQHSPTFHLPEHPECCCTSRRPRLFSHPIVPLPFAVFRQLRVTKWEVAEVQDIERHMMDFIKKQKVPQKNDSIKCLEAENEALRDWDQQHLPLKWPLIFSSCQEHPQAQIRRSRGPSCREAPVAFH